jgi:hypothetical protein
VEFDEYIKFKQVELDVSQNSIFLNREYTMSASDLIHAGYRYYGECAPANLDFGSKPQEFPGKVETICALENGGKIMPEDAYDRIARLLEILESSNRNLSIERNSLPFEIYSRRLADKFSQL